LLLTLTFGDDKRCNDGGFMVVYIISSLEMMLDEGAG
jgi:hypothetical protein